REPLPAPTTEAWLAWGYLVIFGSLLAFTSFVRALQLLPTKIVMTYGYINPVIAVFLGWLFLREPVTPWTLGGAALVLLGVAGIFRERYR
ncbi:MAG: EamA family transporter, partial [Chloroflexota bacterium]